jgi:hypothetical protein
MVPIRDAIRKAPLAQSVRTAVFSEGTAHHVCDVAGTPRHLLTRAALERALRHLLRKPARKIAKKYDLDPRRVPLLIPAVTAISSTVGLAEKLADRFRFRQTESEEQGWIQREVIVSGRACEENLRVCS